MLRHLLCTIDVISLILVPPTNELDPKGVSPDCAVFWKPNYQIQVYNPVSVSNCILELPGIVFVTFVQVLALCAPVSNL